MIEVVCFQSLNKDTWFKKSNYKAKSTTQDAEEEFGEVW